MLKKRLRLTTKDVGVVLSRGRSSRAGHLSMKYLPTSEPLKTSIVVSKSVAKKAVERNRVRRAAYRALAILHTTQSLPRTGLAVIFVQKVPHNPLSPAFHSDLAQLMKA